MPRLACYLLVILSLLAGPAVAQTSIVAVVNGQPITSYDVAQRQRLMQITGAKGNLRKQALDELIDERLQIEAASASRINVSDAQVDQAVASIAQRVKLSPSQLATALGQAGVNISTLRERLKAQISFGQLTRARFGSSLQVSEQDLVAALLRNEDLEKKADTFEYDLTRVMIALPDNPSQQRLNQAQGIARNVRAKFNNCETGIPMAKQTIDVVVLPYGRRTHAELSKQIADAVEGIDQGKLTEPIRTAQGLMMLAICKKTPVRSTNAAMKALEADMQEERNDAFLKQFSRQLRRDAVIEMR